MPYEFDTCEVCGGWRDMGMCECAYREADASYAEGAAWREVGVEIDEMIAARQILDSWGQEDAAGLAIQAALSIEMAR